MGCEEGDKARAIPFGPYVADASLHHYLSPPTPPGVDTRQVCDTLAAAGFNVAMPDFFKGKPWLLERFPPQDP